MSSAPGGRASGRPAPASSPAVHPTPSTRTPALPAFPHYLLVDAETGEHIATVPAPRGVSVFHACQRTGVPLATRCRGNAICGLCRVEVLDGGHALAPAAEDERALLGPEADAGLRLACRLQLPEAARRLVLGIRPADRVRQPDGAG